MWNSIYFDTGGRDRPLSDFLNEDNQMLLETREDGNRYALPMDRVLESGGCYETLKVSFE